jgi:hypothetical protein
MRRAGILVGLASLVALVGISLRAGSIARRATATQEQQAPKPGPEMQKLSFLIGSWDTQSEYEKSAMTPNGAKQKGWYKAQLGPGGFSVLADFEEDGPAGKEIGHEIISWDPKKDAYTTLVVGNSFPGAVMGTAKWEGENLVIQNEMGEGKSAMHLRAMYLHPHGNVVQIEESMSIGDAPFKLIYKSTATKK